MPPACYLGPVKSSFTCCGYSNELRCLYNCISDLWSCWGLSITRNAWACIWFPASHLSFSSELRQWWTDDTHTTFFMTTRYHCECFTKHSYWLTGSICQGHTQLNLPLLATVQEFLLNATWGGLLNHRLTWGITLEDTHQHQRQFLLPNLMWENCLLAMKKSVFSCWILGAQRLLTMCSLSCLIFLQIR